MTDVNIKFEKKTPRDFFSSAFALEYLPRAYCLSKCASYFSLNFSVIENILNGYRIVLCKIYSAANHIYWRFFYKNSPKHAQQFWFTLPKPANTKPAVHLKDLPLKVYNRTNLRFVYKHILGCAYHCGCILRMQWEPLFKVRSEKFLLKI